MDVSSSRVWLVTGCSSGLGRAIAEAVIAKGDAIVVTARSLSQVVHLQERAPGRVLAAPLDVVDELSVKAAVDAAHKRFGRVDVLVNNAGVGSVGAVEESDPQDLSRIYDTNVFGTLRVTQTVLPEMRRQSSGHIIFVSSMGAILAQPSAGIYSSSKAAIDAIAEALACEVAPLGIKVSSILPGQFRTNFRPRGMVHAKTVIADYDNTVGVLRKRLSEPYPDAAGDPASVAQAVLSVVEHPGPPPLRVMVGADAVAALKQRIMTLQGDLLASEVLAGLS